MTAPVSFSRWLCSAPIEVLLVWRQLAQGPPRMFEQSAFVATHHRLPNANQLLVRNVPKVHFLGQVGILTLKQIHVVEGDQAADLRRNGPMLVANRNLRVLVIRLVK